MPFGGTDADRKDILWNINSLYYCVNNCEEQKGNMGNVPTGQTKLWLLEIKDKSRIDLSCNGVTVATINGTNFTFHEIKYTTDDIVTVRFRVEKSELFLKFLKVKEVVYKVS